MRDKRKADNDFGNDNMQEKSGGEILSEILHLLGVFLLKLLRHLLRMILRGIIWTIDAMERLWQSIVDYWNDNSTQEKVRKFNKFVAASLRVAGHWMRKAGRQLLKFTIAAAKATKRGTIWLCREIIHGITHLKPTLIRLGHLCQRIGKWIWRQLGRFAGSVKAYFARRREAYRTFRKNKGFKGLLMDIKAHLQVSLKDYMEEDQEEASDETISDEELIKEGIGSKSKTRHIGQKIYEGMNDIVSADKNTKRKQ